MSWNVLNIHIRNWLIIDIANDYSNSGRVDFSRTMRRLVNVCWQRFRQKSLILAGDEQIMKNSPKLFIQTHKILSEFRIKPMAWIVHV